MKKILLFAFVLILTACSAQPPQVTVTSVQRVTVTLPPPTAAIIPTPTLSPEFLEFQAEVAAMGTEVNIGSDGVFYDKAGNPIDGISTNPATGETKIMVNGEPLVIESSRVHVSDTGGIIVEGYGFDPTTGNFIEKFNSEIWAGTTEHGAEFVSNLDLWKVDEATKAAIKCEGNLCYDPDGKEIYDSATGQYNLDWLLKILPNSGDLGGPQYPPDLRGHPVDSEKSGQEFGVPTFRQFRDEYKQSTNEEFLTKKGTGRMRTVLCDSVNNYWCLAVGKVEDGKTIYNYLLYKTRSNENVIMSIPIKHPADW